LVLLVEMVLMVEMVLLVEIVLMGHLLDQSIIVEKKRNKDNTCC